MTTLDLILWVARFWRSSVVNGTLLITEESETCFWMVKIPPQKTLYMWLALIPHQPR